MNSDTEKLFSWADIFLSIFFFLLLLFVTTSCWTSIHSFIFRYFFLFVCHLHKVIVYCTLRLSMSFTCIIYLILLIFSFYFSYFSCHQNYVPFSLTGCIVFILRNFLDAGKMLYLWLNTVIHSWIQFSQLILVFTNRYIL